MRTIVTMGGLVFSCAILILIQSSITSGNIRNNESNNSLENTVESAIDHVLKKDGFNAIMEEYPYKFYKKTDDNSLFKMNKNQYNDFLLITSEESGDIYVTGICYDKYLLQIVKKDSGYEVRTNMGGTALWFKVPLQDLSSQDLNEVMKETSFVSGEVIAYADSLLYTNFNIYDENNHNLLLKKNLLADKEVLLLDTIYIELLNTINSDSMISLGIIDVNYEKGSLDILVTEKFHYPNGRAGSASCRKAIYSKI